MSAARKSKHQNRNHRAVPRASAAPRRTVIQADEVLRPVPRLMERGQIEDALGRIQQVLAADPRHPRAQCDLATLSMAMRDFAQANQLLADAETVGGKAVRRQVSAVRGDIAHMQNRLAEAEAAYAVAIVTDPDAAPDEVRARALLGLAKIELSRDDVERACDHIREAAEIDPESHAIQHYLARALDKVNDQVGALNAFSAAVKLKGDDPALLNDMGALLSRIKRLEEAAKAFRIAVQLRPNFPEALNNLGVTLYQMRQIEEAGKAWRECLKYDPKNAFAAHMAAAAQGGEAPDRASAEYVAVTFDNFAPDFEDKLAKLRYQGPELLRALIADYLGTGSATLSVLDAGCGTGLCAPVLRPYARTLLGVDLSAGMLEKAKKRGIYDNLLQGELIDHLGRHPEAYNLIASGDVLIYFGDLQPVTAAAASALVPGGYLAFTLERFVEGTADYKLHPHGRYSHSEEYVRAVAAKAGLELVRLGYDIIRYEGQDAVHGFVVLLQKPAAC